MGESTMRGENDDEHDGKMMGETWWDGKKIGEHMIGDKFWPTMNTHVLMISWVSAAVSSDDLWFHMVLSLWASDRRKKCAFGKQPRLGLITSCTRPGRNFSWTHRSEKTVSGSAKTNINTTTKYDQCDLWYLWTDYQDWHFLKNLDHINSQLVTYFEHVRSASKLQSVIPIQWPRASCSARSVLRTVEHVAKYSSGYAKQYKHVYSIPCIHIYHNCCHTINYISVAISSTYQTTDFISQAAPDSGFSTSTLFPPGNADVSPQLMQLDTCHLGSLGKAHLTPSAAHHEDMAMAAGTRVKMC